MSAWNFMSYESKDNLLEAIRRESAGMFELAADPEAWTAPTGAGHWEVRDVFGHLIDTTETYSWSGCTWRWTRCSASRTR
jgi:hypothetical protein